MSSSEFLSAPSAVNKETLQERCIRWSDAAQSFIFQGAPNLQADKWLLTFVEDAYQPLSILSHSPPELPSLCQQKSIKNQIIEVIEINDVVQSSLPSEYGINVQDDSIVQSRKRAIVVLIVFTNLVPVCQPIVRFRIC